MNKHILGTEIGADVEERPPWQREEVVVIAQALNRLEAEIKAIRQMIEREFE